MSEIGFVVGKIKDQDQGCFIPRPNEVIVVIFFLFFTWHFEGGRTRGTLSKYVSLLVWYIKYKMQ